MAARGRRHDSRQNVFDTKGNALAKVSPGFQNAFGNLGFIAKFGKSEEIEVVFDMYLSSRNHPSQTYATRATSSSAAFRRTCRA